MGLALLILGCFGLLTSSVFLGMVLLAAFRFKREQSSGGDFTPPVTLLKPLHGAEPGLAEYLETFFQLDYPDFEILFCARHEGDAGLQLAKSIAAKYPNIRTRFLTSGEPPWPNARCYSLSVMSEAAAHDIFVITDSDVRVKPNYLRDVLRPFRDEAVGLVTCVYRGVAAQGGFWARLEALGMSVEMTSGVIVANMLEGMRFALGPSMIVRKRCIEKIGGFRVLGSYYADDFMLGNLVAANGSDVRLSEHVIDHCIVNLTWKKSLDHQLNWMKSTRFSRPAGHLGTGLVFCVPFGVLAGVGAWIHGWPILGLGLFLFAVAMKILHSILIGALIEDKNSILWSWLYPLRDLFGFMFWVGSYGSRQVGWRDDQFLLTAGGVVRRVGDERETGGAARRSKR